MMKIFSIFLCILIPINFSFSQSLSECLNKLKSKNAQERMFGAMGLWNYSRQGVKGVKEALIKATNDPDYNVRREAVGSLGANKDVSVIPTILKCVNDKNGDVSSQSILALHNIVPTKTIDETKNIREWKKYSPICAKAIIEYATKYYLDDPEDLYDNTLKNNKKIRNLKYLDPYVISALTRWIQFDNKGLSPILHKYLKDDKSTENIEFISFFHKTFIAAGYPESESILISILNITNYKDMAISFLNSGNKKLYDAAIVPLQSEMEFSPV